MSSRLNAYKKFIFLVPLLASYGCMTTSYHQSARSLRNQEKNNQMLVSWSYVTTTFSSESSYQDDKNKETINFFIPTVGGSSSISQELDLSGRVSLAYDARLYGSAMLKRQLTGEAKDPFAVAIAAQLTHGELGCSEAGGSNIVVKDLGLPLFISWYLPKHPVLSLSIFPEAITLTPQYLLRYMQSNRNHPDEILHYFGSNIGVQYSQISIEASYLRTRQNSTQSEISFGIKF